MNGGSSDRTLEARIQDERLDASQKEWERWDRVTRVVMQGISAGAAELREIATRYNYSAADERDLLRVADGIDASVEGFEWLVSPVDMHIARQRAQAPTTTETNATHGR